MQIKLPGDSITIHNKNEEVTVIASCYITDEDQGFLVLRDRRPFYAYVEGVESYGMANYTLKVTFENIVPATKYYHDETSCY